MDLTTSAGDVVDALREPHGVVVAIGAATHAEVGNPITTSPASHVAELRVASGIVAYDPADLTVTVLAGTSVAELQATLAPHGQQVVLDPRSNAATVGGVVSTGLSGIRRLRHGPLRDSVLEIRFVDGSGALIKAGGPTVKNVTGYDLPRLLVGSLGTLGVIVQVTLRCRPLPAARAWFASERPPAQVRASLYRPSALLCDGARTHVLIEGYPDDLAAEAARADLGEAVGAAPPLVEGEHRGRISVAANAVADVCRDLEALDGVRWLAEIGVGTVHVAADTTDALRSCRAAATAFGGWMLREAGGGDLDGFGIDLPNRELMQRVKDAFDPQRKLSPGRLPL